MNMGIYSREYKFNYKRKTKRQKVLYYIAMSCWFNESDNIVKQCRFF